MGFFFLQNMLENGHSNMKTKFRVHITSNIFKIIQFKNHGIAPTPPPPDLPTLKAYLTPGVGGRFKMFSLKWRERMNLKVPGTILPLGCTILSTRAKTVWGVVATPRRRTRVKPIKSGTIKISKKMFSLKKVYLFLKFSSHKIGIAHKY